MQKKLKRKSKKSYNEKIFVAGSGGQGVLFLGKALFLTAVGNGYQATFFPSYGAEVRGGITKCMVTVSTDKTATPIFQKPDSAIVLNDFSLKTYKNILSYCSQIILLQKEEKKVKPLTKRQKIYTFSTRSVSQFENVRSAALYCHFAKWFSKDDFLRALTHILKQKKPDLIIKNREAFEESFAWSKRYL